MECIRFLLPASFRTRYFFLWTQEYDYRPILFMQQISKGTNLAKQLRELPEYKYTPIIFETALAGEELSAYRDVKCYSFLVKPFGEEEFAAAFRDALGLSKQMNQAAGIGGGSCWHLPISAQKSFKTIKICSPDGSRPHRSDKPAYPSRSAYRSFAGPPPYCRPDGA